MQRRSDEDKARILINKIMTEENVRVFMEVINKTDTILFKHCVNVAFLVAQECYKIRCTEEELWKYTRAALLHDVGKLKVEIGIIQKQAGLTKEEFEQVKKHSVYGYEMLKEAGFSDEIATIVRGHHEKRDGSGYPDRLTGKEMHPGSVIISIVDAYDALTSDRSYKSSITKLEAIDTLRYEGVYEDYLLENLIEVD